MLSTQRQFWFSMPELDMEERVKGQSEELLGKQLKALLEMMQALNTKLSDISLLKIYYYTLLAHLRVRKLALYVPEGNTWVCKFHSGTPHDFTTVKLPESIQALSDPAPISQLKVPEEFKVFRLAIPIIHDELVLASLVVDNEQESSPEIIDQSFLQTMTYIVMVAIENRRLNRRQLEQEAMRKEMEIAREVQTMLFPRSLPNNSRYALHASYLPHHTIGGDYYDYVQIDEESFLICIADVSGKGVPASLLMSNFQACLRTLLRQSISLEELVRTLNFQIYSNAIAEKFITAFFAVYNTVTRELSYVNAGHNPPILQQENGTLQMLEKGCTMLGIIDQLPFIEVGMVVVEPRSFLLCYTDGLTEVFNSDEEEFGEENTIQILKETKYFSSAAIHTELLRQIEAYKKENTTFDDDITLLSCRFK